MDSIPLKDIMYQAKHLMQVAERCKSYNSGISSQTEDLQVLIQDAKNTLVQEAEILDNLLIKGTYTIVSNRKIQTRIEYYISILNFILNGYYQEIISLYKDILNHLFKLFRLIQSIISSLDDRYNPTEDDLLSISNTVSTFPLVDFRLFRSDKESINPDLTDWYSIAFSVLPIVINNMITKYPESRTFIPIGLTESISLVSSNKWQIQYFALGNIRIILLNEFLSLQKLDDSGTSKSNQIESSSFKKLTASSKASTKKSFPKSEFQGSSKEKKKTETLDVKRSVLRRVNTQGSICSEIFRNGFLRTLCWTLVHSHFLIREQSIEILNLILKIANHADALLSGSNNTENISELWQSSIEQGLIPILEAIRSGQEIFVSISEQKVPKFPELEVRNIALEFLKTLSSKLENYKFLRQRVINALQHSNNSKLRLNILSSVLFLIGYNNKLGKLIWDESNESLPNVSGSMSSLSFAKPNMSENTFPSSSSQLKSGNLGFTYMIHNLIHDTVNYEIKSILKLFINIFQTVINHVQPSQDSEDNQPSSENLTFSRQSSSNNISFRLQPPILTDLPISSTSPAIQILSMKLLPIIIIQQIKMVCPPVLILKYYTSQTFAALIQFHHSIQMEIILDQWIKLQRKKSNEFNQDNMINIWCKSLETDWYLHEKEILFLHNNLEPKYFFSIKNSSYSIWQELFSHMTEDPVLLHSISKLEITSLQLSYQLSLNYQFSKLKNRYEIFLLDRMQPNSILHIFETSLSIFHHISLPPSDLFSSFFISPEIISQSFTNLTSSSEENQSKIKHINMKCCLGCLQYLLNNWEIYFKKRSAIEVSKLVNCLNRLLGFFLCFKIVD